MEWYKRTFSLPIGCHPEYAPVFQQLYDDYFWPLDDSQVLKPIFYQPYLRVHVVATVIYFYLIESFVGFSYLYTSFLLLDDFNQAIFPANMFLVFMVTVGILFQGAKLLWNKNETTFDLLFSLVHGRENHCTYTGTPYDEFLKSRRHTFLQYGPTLFTYTNITVMSMYVWLPPLVDCIMGVTHHPNDPQNGIATTLGLPMWTPLDADHSWTSYFIVIYMQITFFRIVTVSWAFGIFYTSIFQLTLLDEMRLLRKSLQEIDTRATQLFTLKYQRQPVNRKTKEYDDCYYECLKENIIHHQFIRKIYGEYQKRVGWTIAIPIYLSSVVLALSSSYIMLDNRNALKRSMDVLRIIGDSLLTFLTCHAGEMIAYENDELRNELYNTEWYDRSKKVKQAISICLHITYMPMRLYGGYMVFNHELLSTIVNSAYSVFNFFRVIQKSAK